jgi:hypothetical protein
MTVKEDGMICGDGVKLIVIDYDELYAPGEKVAEID